MEDALRNMGLAGTTAVIAVNVTHPIEVVKTNMQLKSNFSLAGFAKAEGPPGFYRGIQAAWLREVTYTSMKLGLYGPMKDVFGASGSDAPFVLKFAAGSTAGGLGSVVGNPWDLVKTRLMTSTGTPIPLGKAVKAVYAEQGLAGMWRGVGANVTRACVLNGTKMACYDQIKGYVVGYTGWDRKAVKTQFMSAAGAGFCMACTVSPIDMVRSQLMKEGNTYKGIVDCGTQMVKKGGPFALYKGFWPIYLRFAPQATLQLLIFEQLRKLAGLETI